MKSAATRPTLYSLGPACLSGLPIQLEREYLDRLVSPSKLRAKGRRTALCPAAKPAFDSRAPQRSTPATSSAAHDALLTASQERRVVRAKEHRPTMDEDFNDQRQNGGGASSTRSASPEPLATPTLAESYGSLRKNLSVKNLRELEMRELSEHIYRRGKRTDNLKYRPKNDDETFTHALKGGVREACSASLSETAAFADRLDLQARSFSAARSEPQSTSSSSCSDSLANGADQSSLCARELSLSLGDVLYGELGHRH